MAIHTNLNSLLNEMRREMRTAMYNAEHRSHMKALENAEEFYSQGKPKYYKRTGKYGDAPDSTGVTGSGDHLEAEIYMNPSGHGYTTGTFSAQEVWEAAETGGAGVLGIPGRWAQTEQDVEQIVNEEFGGRFGVNM